MEHKQFYPPGKITPLWIVAAFLSLTEVILGYALTQVSGQIQIALTVFVIGFPIAVAVMFFIILWNRPWVFYSPSEYANVDPQKFMAALRDSPEVGKQIKLTKTFEMNPADLDAKFSLIDSMADNVECQFIVFMHETKKDVSRHSPYVFETGEGSAGSGTLSPYGRGNRIEGTGLIRVTGNGGLWTLTDEGHKFAQWLVGKGRKSLFFWTTAGSWGIPKPGGPAEKMFGDMKKNWLVE